MNVATFIVAAVVAATVLLIIFSQVRKGKSGGGCSCGCEGCAGCRGCGSAAEVSKT